MPLAPATRARLQATLAVTIAGTIWWRVHHPVALALFALTAGLALLAWILPSRHAPVQRGLDRLAHALAAGFSWLVLGVVYFGLFTPGRLLRAIAHRPALVLRPDPSAATYLTPLPAPGARRFDRPF